MAEQSLLSPAPSGSKATPQEWLQILSSVLQRACKEGGLTYEVMVVPEKEITLIVLNGVAVVDGELTLVASA